MTPRRIHAKVASCLGLGTGLAAFLLTAPALADSPVATEGAVPDSHLSPAPARAPVESVRLRFGLSGSHGGAAVGQGTWYIGYPVIVAANLQLGVQWTPRFATFATGGVGMLWWYRFGVMAEWTPFLMVAFGAGAGFHAFPITDASAHALTLPLAVTFLPWRHRTDTHGAFAITLSIEPGYTVHVLGDSCYCPYGTMPPDGFTFYSQIEFGFQLR